MYRSRSKRAPCFTRSTRIKKLEHPNRFAQRKAFYVAITFSPDEDAAEQAALMDFNFSCITRLTPCDSEGQILPEAVHLWQERELSGPSL